MRVTLPLSLGLLLAACAGTAPKPAPIGAMEQQLSQATARDGVSVLLDACVRQTDAPVPMMLRSDSAALGQRAVTAVAGGLRERERKVSRIVLAAHCTVRTGDQGWSMREDLSATPHAQLMPIAANPTQPIEPAVRRAFLYADVAAGAGRERTSCKDCVSPMLSASGLPPLDSTSAQRLRELGGSRYLLVMRALGGRESSVETTSRIALGAFLTVVTMGFGAPAAVMMAQANEWGSIDGTLIDLQSGQALWYLQTTRVADPREPATLAQHLLPPLLDRLVARPETAR